MYTTDYNLILPIDIAMKLLYIALDFFYILQFNKDTITSSLYIVYDFHSLRFSEDLKERRHSLCILKNLTEMFQVRHLESVSIFSILDHPCSLLVYFCLFGGCLPWQTII